MFAQCHRYFGNEESQLDHHPRDMDQELGQVLLEPVLVLPELEQELLVVDQQDLAQELDLVPGLGLVLVLDLGLEPALEQGLGLVQVRELVQVLVLELAPMFQFQLKFHKIDQSSHLHRCN